MLLASNHSLYDLLLASMYLTQLAQRLETIETTFTTSRSTEAQLKAE